MFNRLLTSLFGSRNERVVRQLGKLVGRINDLEPDQQALSDEQLAGTTAALRARLAAGEKLDSLIPEAFAAVREAARRTLGLRHYDVQLIGGMVLHQGKIAEMRTGEGKTLVATLPVFLNALPGEGVHVVTVNDYLARRDAEWMGPVYRALGMTVGVVVPGLEPEVKRAAYAADITYGTNNEFGFDYLRDNMAFAKDMRYQRGQHYAIVDEVDSILIDEARTPLIISGPAEDSPQMYVKVNTLVPKLKRQTEDDGPGDYSVDEKQKQIYLTEEGMHNAEQLLQQAGMLKEGEGLYDAQNLAVVHHMNAALRAHAIYQRDVDYIVRDGEVVIVDEFTGRTLSGRRWSDGLHQAVEAKEGVPIQRENHTLASITFQNYFRMYEKLSGMTGTADTEAYEFQTIYGLEVVVIPTHRPMIRQDNSDQVFLTHKAKFASVIEDIRDCHGRGQPVLVGTTSIETSELLSGLLKKSGIAHEVLNAKQHEREAQIVAQAGRPAAVTIATNMAGRGTDIVLGGNLESELVEAGADAHGSEAGAAIREAWKQRHQEVLDAGGLHIIGTERHESRRIDNQLRGRSGRQGDPGSSRFYLSLEDNLMRIFAPPWLASVMQKYGGMTDDDAIEHKMVNRAIENAQRKVEAHNFDIRKHLLDFDDVANDQRKVVYQQRNELMDQEDISETIVAIREDVIAGVVAQYIPPGSVDEQWDVAGLERNLSADFGIKADVQTWVDAADELSAEDLAEKVVEHVERFFREKEAMIGSEVMRQVEHALMLQVLDQMWKEHLANMDFLRQGIHLRGYAQKQPKQEFKREAFELFEAMLGRIKLEVIRLMALLRVRNESDVDAIEAERQRQSAVPMQFQHAAAGPIGGAEKSGPTVAGRQVANSETPFVREDPKVGRNDPCPCGSGKKFKQCHGKLA